VPRQAVRQLGVRSGPVADEGKTVARIELERYDSALRRVDDGWIAGGDPVPVFVGNEAKHRQDAGADLMQHFDRPPRPYLTEVAAKTCAAGRAQPIVVHFDY